MPEPPADAARELWLRMSEFVLENQPRREVSEALGTTFGRARAIRRLARKPMSMGELAGVLGIDPPNATAIVRDLEAQGIVRRRPHPTDGRAKLVEVTPKGKALARKADALLAVPPPGLAALGAEELEALRRLLDKVAAKP